MTKEENPQTQERDFPLSWKAQTPLSYIPTARLLLLFSLQHPIKATTTVCATCYFTDLPTDSSEEAEKLSTWAIAGSRERQWRCRCASLAPTAEAGSSQRR